MTPRFASAVDPVFLYVLHLLKRIENGETPDAEQERLHIRGRIDRAEATLGSSEDWELAKYGLAAWIDETLIALPWSGNHWWVNNPLEFELFRTAEAFSEFYTKAKTAAGNGRIDALEVFYVCVVLGFRGIYQDEQDASAGMQLEQLGLPADVASWAKRTRAQIRYGQGRPPMRDDPHPPEGAPPLEARYEFLGSLVLIAIAALILVFQYQENVFDLFGN